MAPKRRRGLTEAGRCLDGCYGNRRPSKEALCIVTLAKASREEKQRNNNKRKTGEQGGQRAGVVEREGGNNPQTSQSKLQKVRVSMTTACEGRSPLASEAAPI